MPRARPIRSQRQILQLLSAFEYLTTREIYEYLADPAGQVEPATKRAVEHRLRLLLKQDLIGVELLDLARGRASERRWWLLSKGYEALGDHGDQVPGADCEPSGGTKRRGMGANRGATPREAAILHLLAEMQHLTTSQIRRHLHSDKPEWYTWRLLNILRGMGYIRGKRMYPELGAASECFWTIRKAGAEAVGGVYDRRYLRWPARRTIEHRGLLLEMSRQVEDAGWSLVKPVSHRRRLAEPEARSCDRQRMRSSVHGDFGDSPQRERLVEALLHNEAVAIERLIEQGYPVSGLRDRIERLNAGQVGAVVPRDLSDYVAYVPGKPELTAVLIPHPPWAGPGFWARRPGRRRNNTGRQHDRKARLDKYARLLKVLPVIAVFNTERVRQHYAALLSAAGFHSVAVEQVGEKLASLSRSPDGNGREAMEG